MRRQVVRRGIRIAELEAASQTQPDPDRPRGIHWLCRGGGGRGGGGGGRLGGGTGPAALGALAGGAGDGSPLVFEAGATLTDLAPE